MGNTQKIPLSEIIGKRFGSLTAIRETDKKVYSNKYTSRAFLCKCECGNETIVALQHLRKKKIQSCGCYKSNYLRQEKTTHGMKKTRIYSIWQNMKSRCNNTKNKQYNGYGGRGIKIGRKSFEEFKDDMYKSYLEHVEEFGEKNTTLDRKENNSDYSKSNCKRSTMYEQAQNTRKTIKVEINGVTKTLSQRAKERNISYNGLRYVIQTNVLHSK